MTILDNSQLSAQGTIQGDVVNDGEVDMGATVGTIVVTGNFTQGENATLSIKISGPFANEFDQLSVLGAATLDGTLNAELTNGFTPSPGATLTIVKLASPARGAFSTFLSPLNDGTPELDPLNVPGGLGVGDNSPGQSVSVTYPGQPTWQAEGPDIIDNGPRTVATPDNGSVGAVQSIVVSPNGTIYVGTVDGGVWSTSDLTEQMVLDQSSTTPGYLPANFYTPLTDQEPSLAVSTMALDPTDTSGNTLWVGTGALSSANNSTVPTGVSPAGTPTGLRLAGPSDGLLMTTNGGRSWTSFGSAVFNTPILSIVPRGQTILVGTKGQGLWESTDGGADFTQVSFFLSPSLTNAIVSSIVVVPGNSQRYYAALTVTPLDFYGNAKKGSNTILNWNPVPGSIQPSFGDPVSGPGIAPGTLITAVSSTTITLSNTARATSSGAEFGGPSSTTSGIYESADGGSQWFEIDDAIPQIIGSPSLIITANVDDGNTNLFAVTSQVTTIPNPDGGNLVTGVWRVAVPSNPLGNYNWVDTPGPSIANYVDYGHFDAITDPTNPNVIYVCGWEQCLFRVDTTPGNSSWQLLSLNSYGEPHDDIRSLTFLNSTTLIATSDGGIYGLPGLSAPGSFPGTFLTFHWVDLNVDIQDTEFFQVAYDSIDGVIVGGAQDNGTSIQDAGDPGFWSTLSKPAVSNVFGNFGTNSVGGGDGGEVAVDNTGSTATIFLTADGTLKWYDTNGGSGNTGVLPSQLLTQADQNTYTSQAESDASYLFSSNQSVIGGILLGMSSLYMYDPNNVSFLNPLGLSLVSTPFIAGNVTALTGFNTGGTAYFGTSKGQLFMSTGGLGTFGALSSFALIQSPGAWYPGGVPNGTHAIQVVGDPNDPRTIYVLDSNGQVWGNAKVGYDPWINITGDLGTFTNNANLGNTVTSLQLYDPTPYTGNSVLLVGALGGVFQTGVNLNGASTNPNQSWRLYGEGLPNVQVSSLEYVASDDLLLAGTYGRAPGRSPTPANTSGRRSSRRSRPRAGRSCCNRTRRNRVTRRS